MQTYNPIITVVRDPADPLGKRFDIELDGTINKRLAVSFSIGLAVQRRVPDHDDLAALMNEIGSDPHVAAIDASLLGIPNREKFNGLDLATEPLCFAGPWQPPAIVAVRGERWTIAVGRRNVRGKARLARFCATLRQYLRPKWATPFVAHDLRGTCPIWFRGLS